MKEILFMSGNYLLRVIPIIVTSVFIMNMLQNSGLIRKIAWISGPLIRFGHLKEPMGVTFITSFGSPSAANAMIRSLYDRKVISRKEVFVGVLANAFPVMVMESRTMLPVMVSLIGKTGFLMFSILLILRLIQTILVLIAGRFLFDSTNGKMEQDEIRQDVFRGKELLHKSLKDTWPTIRRILMITAPVTILTFILLKAGLFDILAAKIQFLSNLLPIPVQGMGIVAAYFGHYVAGYTMAGSMLSGGMLTVKEIIITLLAAKVLSSIFFAIRHSTPYYIGIFGTGLGTRIMLASVLLRNVITLAAVFILYYLW